MQHSNMHVYRSQASHASTNVVPNPLLKLRDTSNNIPLINITGVRHMNKFVSTHIPTPCIHPSCVRRPEGRRLLRRERAYQTLCQSPPGLSHQQAGGPWYFVAILWYGCCLILLPVVRTDVDIRWRDCLAWCPRGVIGR